MWDALPGESFWTDRHPVDEFLYVIEGVAILVPPLREAIEAHPGDVVHMPAGTEHQTMNRGPGPLKVSSARHRARSRRDLRDCNTIRTTRYA